MAEMDCPSILIIEDGNEDYEATLRAFRRSGLPNPVFRCSDGDEALDFLHRKGEYANPEDAPRPGVILLDLNLPGTDGREVLQELKRDSKLKAIPVIVLTTSTDERDVQSCYLAGAACYIAKPVSHEKFTSIIRHLTRYWFECVLLPGEVD